ncbi:hypothetical protein C8J57DRAFT_1220218 [Mycena rebaudengoi]|nr:hypothetical protein C8J57DRAFT_1220218 [Mycena rebaudengoi]
MTRQAAGSRSRSAALIPRWLWRRKIGFEGHEAAEKSRKQSAEVAGNASWNVRVVGGRHELGQEVEKSETRHGSGRKCEPWRSRAGRKSILGSGVESAGNSGELRARRKSKKLERGAGE